MMKKIGEYLFNYLKDIGEEYVTSFFQNYADKLKDWVINLDPKEIADKAKDVKNKLISNFDKKIDVKPNFEKESIFAQFDKKLVTKMIEEIFQEEKINEEIANKFKNDLKSFKMEKNNPVNILVIGEEEENINEFFEMFCKAFNIQKTNKNEYAINIEFQTHFSGVTEIKIIKQLKKNDKDNINFIWNIIDEKIQKIKTKDNNLNTLLESKPIIYIGFKNNVRPETLHNFSNSMFSEENFDDMKYHIMDSFVIDKEQINEEIKDNNNKNINEIFMQLIKKSLLFLLIQENRSQMQSVIDNIYDSTFTRIRFLFGNSIKNFQDFNFQITPIIFKKMLFENKKLPNSVRIKCSLLLDNYQKYLERKQKSYFSEFLSNNESMFKAENDNVKRELCENMASFINEKIYEEDNEKKEEKGQNKEKQKQKQKEMEKQRKKMSKDNAVEEDDINKKMRIKFDDYLLKNSSIFINELIFNTLKDKKKEVYNKEIIQYYFGIYKNDLILSEKDKIFY